MATDADIEAFVFSQLASTSYACSAITRLNGGTANFVYRGVLSNPESIGATEQEKVNVIIKHTKDFVALNRDFKLDGERCVGCVLLVYRSSTDLRNRSSKLWFCKG